VKILLVSQMYPGPDDPDLGAFVQGIERALAERGHEIERVVTEGRGGGKRRHLRLAREVRRASHRFEPNVVYSHFLVPTGLSAALFGGAPLVATAHGRDVRNIGAYPGIAAATRFVARRAASLIAVSDYLRRELEAKIPEARGKTEVVDCGVDLSLFEARSMPGTWTSGRTSFGSRMPSRSSAQAASSSSATARCAASSRAARTSRSRAASRTRTCPATSPSRRCSASRR
jgi:glycosyltransferase involved in cell wall biosynthesis